MLVKLTDAKGNEVWINPIHVKLIREKRGKSEIHMAVGSAWGAAPATLKIRVPAEELVAVLNAGMPDMAYVPDEETGMDQSGDAAAASAMMG